jgi:Uma2 family endonuclease
MTLPAQRFAVAADLLTIPENERFHEIIGGEIVQKAMPSALHASAQALVVTELGGYNRRSGSRGPGGWWILTEADVELEPHEVYRPDVSGWRRTRLPTLPPEAPIVLRPDWVCEVLSRSNARNDRVKKMRVYHHCGVPHYWIVDPDEQTLSVFRWTADGYLLALTAERGEVVRAEPFGEVELSIDEIFGEAEG